MNRVLIIAEAGVNHNGSIQLAKRLIDVAAEAGADFVKFQTFNAAKIVSTSAPKADYQVLNTASTESQLTMLKKLELSLNDHLQLIEYCKQKHIEFLSTPFDEESIHMLKSLGITTGKIPSGEITNRPYLATMAMQFKNLILSTGMCTMEDIAAAIEVLVDNGASKENITILHCNTAYPTPYSDVNLRAMQTIATTFHVNVGYSDHTIGIEVPIAAVALGARIIEKHFTLDKTMEGPDHKASLEPSELRIMVNAIRNIETSLGTADKKPSPSEIKNIAIARKSIHLKGSKKKGELIALEDLEMKRPGDGITPMRMHEVIGKRLKYDVPAEHKLTWKELE